MGLRGLDFLSFGPLRIVFILLILNRNRPYSWSEVIHKPGSKAFFLAFERERPRIVNNFAASALSGYEFSSSSEEDELFETFEPGGCCLSRQRILRLGRIVSETITSGYKEFASVSGRANDQPPVIPQPSCLLESPPRG